MADRAHKYTDRELKRLSERLRYHYRKAARELSKKAEKRLSSYGKSLTEKKKLLSEGAMTAEEFRRWTELQALIAARDTAMVNELVSLAQSATSEARMLIAGEMPDVFAECANLTAWGIDSKLGKGIIFSLVDRDTVLSMMQRDPRLMPMTQRELMKGASKRWHSQKVVSAMRQGILQGESVPSVGKRLMQVTAMDARAAQRAARTAMTCAENMGRLHSMERAEQLGVRCMKEWMATLDDRTRDSHAVLDGERAGVSEAFSNGLRFPGDPSGDPDEVWNCRCTMTEVVETAQDLDMERWDNLPDGMTYDKWKEAASEHQRASKQ